MNPTNIFLSVALLTNAIPGEMTMPNRLTQIRKEVVIQRYVSCVTNDHVVICQTNDVIKSHELRKFTGKMVWTEVPLTEADLKNPFPPLPVPQ